MKVESWEEEFIRNSIRACEQKKLLFLQEIPREKGGGEEMTSDFVLKDFIQEDMYIRRPEDKEEYDKSQEGLFIPLKKVAEFIKRLKKTQHWVTSDTGDHLIVDVEEIDALSGFGSDEKGVEK